jgi:FHS family glucose/mannose:H+ symporter-like MFS transporter
VVLLFLGGGMGILETMSNALLADIDPDNSVFLLNFLQVFFGLGAILGPVAAGVAYSEHISWRVVYQAVGVILIVVTVWFILNKLPPLPKAEKIRVGDVRALLGDGGFLTICFCIFAYTGAESSGWGWLSTYAEKNLSFSAAESGAAVAVFWTAVTAGRFLIALTLKKFDLRKLIAALSLSSAVVCVIMGVLHQKIFAWIVVILLGLACSSQWGLILSFGAERYKRNSGSVFAILLASGGFGMALVPYLTGLAGDLAGMRISLFVPASMFASIAILFSIKYN